MSHGSLRERETSLIKLRPPKKTPRSRVSQHPSSAQNLIAYCFSLSAIAFSAVADLGVGAKFTIVSIGSLVKGLLRVK
jgi:hypothetical protein